MVRSPEVMPPAPGSGPPPELPPFTPDARTELPATAEVVVVGGGLLGASAGYHLARAGMRPLVIEANAPARGAEVKNAGMALAGLGGRYGRVRRLVQAAGGRSVLEYTARSLDLIEAWDAALPGGLEWDRSGSLMLALDPAEEGIVRGLAADQAAEGLEVQVIGADALRGLAPGIATDAVLAAKWTPRDGTLNPLRLRHGLLEAVRDIGGAVVTGVRVERVLARDGRASGVATTAGEVSAGSVLLATGAWTPALVGHLASNLTPIPETVCMTEVLPFRIGEPGFATNQGNVFWRQMRSGEILLGSSAVADQETGIASSSIGERPQVPRMLAAVLARLHPRMRDVRITRCSTAVLDFASLEIPMAGPLPSESGQPLPGAFVAAGLTGHGTAYAPILGLLVAELISSGAARTLSLDPFDPRRYVGVTHAPTWLDPPPGTTSDSR